MSSENQQAVSGNVPIESEHVNVHCWEHHKQTSIRLHCIEVEAETSAAHTTKPNTKIPVSASQYSTRSMRVFLFDIPFKVDF